MHLAMCPHFPYILCLPKQCNARGPGATGGDVAPPATTLTELQRQVDGLGERGQDAVLRFFSDRGAAREEGRRHLLDQLRLSQAQVRELID